jgi:hypothetical protein
MFCDDFEFKSICFYDPRKLIQVLRVTVKNHSLFFSFDTQSGMPSSTQSGTPSDTPSDTPSCTKTMGDLAVMVLETNDG